MRVLEILRNEVREISEEQLIEKIKNFDWRSEFSEDFRKAALSRIEMQVIENQVFRLWKKNPSRAISIWNEYCPYAAGDNNVIPSFIYRLQHQEETQV